MRHRRKKLLNKDFIFYFQKVFKCFIVFVWYFSIEDCSDGPAGVDSAGKCKKTKRHYYKVLITFRFTEEKTYPRRLPNTDVLPDFFGPDPVPRFLTPRGIEFIINQGQDFIQLFPEEIKNQYGLNGLLDRENQLVTNELIPGYLNQAYQKHFNAENR